MIRTKYLEYYMDSKIYSKDEVQKSIDETKKEFPKKEIDVQVHLNRFGVYVVTFAFFKQDKIQKRFEKYSNKKYGQYKATGVYRPY